MWTQLWSTTYTNIIERLEREAPRYRRLAKESGWVVLGQAITVLGSLVLVRVLTEYLDSSQYGQLALGLTVATLVNKVVMGGVSGGIGRFYSIAAEKDDLGAYVKDTRRLLGYSTLVVLGIGSVLVSSLTFLDYSRWIPLTISAVAFSLLSGYNTTLNNIQNAARQRAIVAAHNGLNAWLKIGLAVGLMLWFGTSSTVVVAGYSCAVVMVTLSQLVFLRRTIQPESRSARRKRSWTGDIWSYSWPFSVWGIFTWMQQVSDRWALEIFGTTQDVGLYAVLFQLGYTPIATGLGMIMSFIGPILFIRSGDARNDARNKVVHNLTWKIVFAALASTALVFLISILIHDEIFRVLVADEYRSISYMLPWVLLSGGLVAAGQMLSLKLMSELKSNQLLKPKVTTAIVAVGLNIVGAALTGVLGIVAAMLTIAVMYFVWMAALTMARRGNS